jgi:hypothetical protein
MVTVSLFPERVDGGENVAAPPLSVCKGLRVPQLEWFSHNKAQSTPALLGSLPTTAVIGVVEFRVTDAAGGG